MFTVEFESDAAVITTLDQSDMHEDVEVIFGDDGDVYMRQFEPDMDFLPDDYHERLSNWLDLMAAYKSSEGLILSERLQVMNELGQGFFAGVFAMYVLALPLLYHMVEPEDEEMDNSGPIKFAFLWPLIALGSIIPYLCRRERQ